VSWATSKARTFASNIASAEGNEDLLPTLATELVGLNIDVIVTYASGVFAAQRATATIPIVTTPMSASSAASRDRLATSRD
jgi:ABC-type uncharacterized transport system substrate-binding protein